MLTALENVELPLLLDPSRGAERKTRARTALRIVGLEDRPHHFPRQLSGGQEQRVAIARAIVNDLTIFVADEPTGDLDRKSADEVLALLETLNKELGKTILMVTHDPAAAERARIIRRLDKGRLAYVTLASLALRSLGRNKFRAFLTVTAVAVSIVAFLLLRTVVWAWASGAEWSAKDRIVTRHKVTFVIWLPKHYIDVVRQAPHIKTATWATWFGAKDPKHETEFFTSLAVDPATYFDVYNEVDVAPDAFDTWKHDRQGAIVGDVLAKKLGWKVGDRITLKSGIFPGDWAFTVDGIYTARTKSFDRSTLLFSWAYLNDCSRPAEGHDRLDSSAASTIRRAPQHRPGSRQALRGSRHADAFAGRGGLQRIVLGHVLRSPRGARHHLGGDPRHHDFDRRQHDCHGRARANAGVRGAEGDRVSARSIALWIVVEAIFLAIAGGVAGVALAYPFINYGVGRFIEENMGSIVPYFRLEAANIVLALRFVCAARSLGGWDPGVPSLENARDRRRATSGLRGP